MNKLLDLYKSVDKSAVMFRLSSCSKLYMNKKGIKTLKMSQRKQQEWKHIFFALLVFYFGFHENEENITAITKIASYVGTHTITKTRKTKLTKLNQLKFFRKDKTIIVWYMNKILLQKNSFWFLLLFGMSFWNGIFPI